MAGGFKTFGPTYNATKYVRLAHEGMINGSHAISQTIVDAKTEELAGKIAAIGATGVELSNKGAKAVGLLTEDLGDMINASLKASFYFRGGEYYVATSRMGADSNLIVAGDELTTDAVGRLVKLTDAATEKAVGVATTAPTEYRMGNMYEHAGTGANGGNFVGFILYL